MSKKRMMRNPELWIGRRIPSDMSDDHLWDWGVCDDCQRFYHLDQMHALLWPISEADWLLQKAVGVEEAQSFCADCLAEIQADADKVDPEWRKRHGYEVEPVIIESLDPLPPEDYECNRFRAAVVGGGLFGANKVGGDP